jgi:hypothetical protein
MQGLAGHGQRGALQTALGTLAVTSLLSMVSPGYVKLANGLIIQWGSVSVPGDTRPTVNYPVAFTTFGRCRLGSGGERDRRPGNCRIVAATNANFQVCNNDGGSATFWWIAVGK